MPWQIVDEPKPVQFYPVETDNGTEFRRVGGLMVKGTIRHSKADEDQVWRVVYTNRAGRGSFSITAPDRTVERQNHKLDFVKVKAKATVYREGNRKGGMTPTAFQRELAEMCGGNFAGSFYGQMVNAVKVALGAE